MQPAPAARYLRWLARSLLLLGATLLAVIAVSHHGAPASNIAPAYAAPGDCDAPPSAVTKGAVPIYCPPPTPTATPAPAQPTTPVSTPAASQTVPGSLTTPLTPSGPINISGRSDIVLQNLRITSTTGPCVLVYNSQRVTILDSEIGPCGGKGIEVNRSSTVRISDSYIHPEFAATGCCDSGDAIHAILASNLVIQGNVIAYGETNVELQGVSNVDVLGNYLVNPQGPFPRGGQIQVWAYGSTRSTDVNVYYNYALASKDAAFLHPESQWDAISAGQSDRVTVSNNYVIGGRSHSGCGIVADVDANSMQFLSNTVIDTGQCGIGIGSGTNQVVDGNRIYGIGLALPDAGNTALYIWNQYTEPCGPVRISNNVAVLTRPDGQLSSYWDGGGCGSPSLANNVWDRDAINQLSPVEQKFPPPPAPPMPYKSTARAAEAIPALFKNIVPKGLQ